MGRGQGRALRAERQHAARMGVAGRTTATVRELRRRARSGAAGGLRRIRHRAVRPAERTRQRHPLAERECKGAADTGTARRELVAGVGCGQARGDQDAMRPTYTTYTKNAVSNTHLTLPTK